MIILVLSISNNHFTNPLNTTEMIEWFIDDQTFLRSYDLAPRIPPSFSVFLCVAGRAYWRERGGEFGHGVESYNRKKAEPSIDPSILSGTTDTGDKIRDGKWYFTASKLIKESEKHICCQKLLWFLYTFYSIVHTVTYLCMIDRYVIVQCPC